jgi:hypothetical protein
MSKMMSSVAAVAAMSAAAVWPGLSTQTAAEFTRVGRGLPIAKPNVFAQRHERYYHILDYAVGGHTNQTYFNVGANDGVCNLNNGEIPTERPMWLTGLCITFQDLTAAGARSGAQLSVSATTAATRAEEVRSILQSGLLKISIGDRPIFEAQDLTHFPSDGGFYLAAGGLTFSAATNSSIAQYNNGEPIAGNRFQLPRPWPVLPGKRIRVDLIWPQALAISTAGRIKVELVGESVVALNA